LFREGDPGDCMYEIQTGSVGVFHDYKGPNEKLITRLYSGKLCGEMGLFDHAPRSATVVVMEDNCTLTAISEDGFYSYFQEKPVVVLELMQQMCNRLRRTTKDYVEACHTVYDAVETEKSGKAKNKSLMNRIKALCDAYNNIIVNENYYYPYF
jgi:CRP-like cAMP-binding protein